MKFTKSVMMLLLCMATLILASCNKCATCQQTITTTGNASVGGLQSSTTTFEVCGDDLKAVNGQTSTSTSSYGGYTATVTSRTVCN